MGMNSSVVDGYPVKLALMDFVYVFVAMSVVTIIISSRPATLAARFVSVKIYKVDVPIFGRKLSLF